MSHCCKGPMLNLFVAGFFSFLTALCFPFLTLLFGHVFNEFINYNLAVKISTENLSDATVVATAATQTPSSTVYHCNLSTQSDIAEYMYPNSHHMLHLRVATLTFLNLAVSLFFFVVAAISRSFSAVAAAQMGRRLRHRYFRALLKKPIGWYEGSNWLSELPSTLLLEGIQIIEIGMTCSTVLLQRLTVVVTCLSIAFYVNWKLALVTSFLLPFLMFFSYIIIKAISLIAVKEQDALLLASSVAEESLLFIETVRIFEGQQKQISRYLEHIEKANGESRKIVMLTALMVGLLYFFILTIFTIGSWFGLHLMLECVCEPGDIILVTAEVVVCGFSISELLPAIGEVVAGFQSASLIKKVINERVRGDHSRSSETGMILRDFEGSIEFSDVVFSYSSWPDDTVLRGINFKVSPGQTVALVGHSGCGQSSIFKLISKLYDIDSGMIRFDNVDGKYLNLKWLRRQIGIVSEELQLFGVSIATNIGYGKEGATMEEIITAAKMANAHGFITDLPYGYSSLVGEEEGGVSLTQGQKVLIGIARAIIRNPKILLIDNKNCKFNQEMEETISLGIDKARERRTTFIIPHRLSSIETADLIIGIDSGHVVEMGTHSQLLEKNGLYKSLLMKETYKDEFSSIADAEVDDDVEVDDIDSNRLAYELEKCMDSTQSLAAVSQDDYGTAAESSEKSPLLPTMDITNDQTKTDDTDGMKQTAISLYKEILTLVFNRRHWILLSLALFFFILAGCALSSFFIFFEKLQEYFNSTNPTEISLAANVYSPLFSSLGLFVMILNFIGYTVLSVCEENLNAGIRGKTLSGLLNQRVKWFAKNRLSLDGLSNLLSTDANKICQVLNIRVGSIAWSTIAVLGALSASFVLCWPIGFTLLPSYVWILIVAYLHCKFTKRYLDYRNTLMIDATKKATEAVKNIRTVVQFDLKDLLLKLYDNSLNEPFRCDTKHAAIVGIIYGLSQMLIFLFIGFGYLIGTFLVLSSSFKFTYSDILTSLFTIWFASQIFKGRFDIIPGLQDGAVSSKKILKYFSEHSDAGSNAKNRQITPTSKVKYSLQLKNMWSAHDNIENENGKSLTPALSPAPTPAPLSSLHKSFPLSVNPGETLALVGPDFSRDQTILSLVDKIDSPVPNTLLLDGVDVCDINALWLQRQVGFISRYPILLNMSIMENIKYGVNYRYVSSEEVIQVAKIAGVHSVLNSLPEGYDTIVGFCGFRLSLEQQLCVAIARTMIRDPKILFMDDGPLFANEKSTLSIALNKLREGRTTVVIASKQSTIKAANCIAVIHKGKILEQGAHSELMEKKGAYFIMNDILEEF